MNKSLLKSLDAAIGPFLVSRARPRAREPSLLGGANRPLAAGDVKSLLVVRPGGIGDALLLLPLLQALRARFPEAALSVLAERRNAGGFLIEENPPEVFRYDLHPLKTFRALRRRAFDLVVDTEQFHHLSTLFANRLAPRYLCGYATLGRVRLFTHAAPYSEDVYEVDSFLNLFEALTGERPPVDPDAPFLVPAKAFDDWASQALASLEDRPLAVFTPGAGSPHRLWPAERFCDVAQFLSEQGLDVVTLGGADAAEASRRIVASLPQGRGLNLTGSTSLGQTAAVIARVKLLVTPDTGTLHVARAVGTPTVSLFGSGRQKKWGPPGRRHIQLNLNLPCSPCTVGAATPPCPRGYACMRDLPAQAVVAAAERLLRELSS